MVRITGRAAAFFIEGKARVHALERASSRRPPRSFDALGARSIVESPMKHRRTEKNPRRVRRTSETSPRPRGRAPAVAPRGNGGFILRAVFL